MQLKTKTVIVTGASSGIGRAAARLFASEGAQVVLGARRQEALGKTVEQIVRDGGQAVALAGDVKDEAYAAALVETAVAAFGGLDAAFNNAGTVGDLSPLPEMASGNWEDVIATNLTSAFFAAKHQIPAMTARGSGAVLFTSSFVGHEMAGLPGMGAYAASKAGLIGLTRSLAVDHGGAGLRVNALLPGGTKTPMAGEDGAVHERIGELHALHRMAEPEEVAEAALFLLSDRASFVTGSAMLVDGGVSIKLM